MYSSNRLIRCCFSSFCGVSTYNFEASFTANFDKIFCFLRFIPCDQRIWHLSLHIRCHLYEVKCFLVISTFFSQSPTKLTLSPPEGPCNPTVFIENCEFLGGKAFRVLIDLKGYGHCIYLLLFESLIVIPPGKRRSALGFPVKLNFSRG